MKQIENRTITELIENCFARKPAHIRALERQRKMEFPVWGFLLGVVTRRRDEMPTTHRRMEPSYNTILWFM